MKLTHKQKLKMARKMMTQKEISAGVSPFQCHAWNQRSFAKEVKVHRIIKLARLKRAAKQALVSARERYQVSGVPFSMIRAAVGEPKGDM